MINIGEISKPSVEPKSGAASDKDSRTKKVDTLSPIDATRNVKSSTRREQKTKDKRGSTNTAINDSQEEDPQEYDEKGKTTKSHHIDLKA